jgi:adenylylsulfate reductase subunit B
MPPVINYSKCINCALCAQICPLDVIRKVVDFKTGQIKVSVKYPYECWHCLSCVKDCPKKAIHLRYPLSHMMYTMDISENGESENEG